MNDKTFIDTNVLIYGHNVDAKAKHEAAKRVLQELWNSRSGALSMQVLQEFYMNVTRKIPRPISRASARLVVNTYTIWCVETTPSEIFMAFHIEDESHLGFWDALIVAAAIKSGAHRILSEDLNAGQTISGVRIENPFAKTQ
jgi:predicted nucleic acid-binding protein